jgi:hypothetical protein
MQHMFDTAIAEVALEFDDEPEAEPVHVEPEPASLFIRITREALDIEDLPGCAGGFLFEPNSSDCAGCEFQARCHEATLKQREAYEVYCVNY